MTVLANHCLLCNAPPGYACQPARDSYRRRVQHTNRYGELVVLMLHPSRGAERGQPWTTDYDRRDRQRPADSGGLFRLDLDSWERRVRLPERVRRAAQQRERREAVAASTRPASTRPARLQQRPQQQAVPPGCVRP